MKPVSPRACVHNERSNCNEKLAHRQEEKNLLAATREKPVRQQRPSTAKNKYQSLSHVQLSGTPCTVTHQIPLSMGFSRQEYWSGLPLPSPGDLPDPGIELSSPALQADSLPSELPGKSPKAESLSSKPPGKLKNKRINKTF